MSFQTLGPEGAKCQKVENGFKPCISKKYSNAMQWDTATGHRFTTIHLSLVHCATMQNLRIH